MQSVIGSVDVSSRAFRIGDCSVGVSGCAGFRVLQEFDPIFRENDIKEIRSSDHLEHHDKHFI